jgi:hypothetical protein
MQQTKLNLVSSFFMAQTIPLTIPFKNNEMKVERVSNEQSSTTIQFLACNEI